MLPRNDEVTQAVVAVAEWLDADELDIVCRMLAAGQLDPVRIIEGVKDKIPVYASFFNTDNQEWEVWPFPGMAADGYVRDYGSPFSPRPTYGIYSKQGRMVGWEKTR